MSSNPRPSVVPSPNPPGFAPSRIGILSSQGLETRGLGDSDGRAGELRATKPEGSGEMFEDRATFGASCVTAEIPLLSLWPA